MTAEPGRDADALRIPQSVNGRTASAAGHSDEPAIGPLAAGEGPGDETRAPGTPLTGGKGGGLLAIASCLLLLLAAAQGYVSFSAQYTFVDHAKQSRVPSMLEALGLDTGAVIFALLALSLARRGRRGTVERVLNVACALGSLAMNLLAANLNSPRSVVVWVMPSALYALASDRLIAVVRRWVQDSDPASHPAADGSAWRAVGGMAFWLLRLILDVPGTTAGFRRWVLVMAPVAPGIRAEAPRPALPAGKQHNQAAERLRGPLPHQQPPHAQTETRTEDTPGFPALAPGETKRHALIRLYEHSGQIGDPRYGNQRKTAELAGEIAGLIGYHAGTARRELTKYLASQRTAVKDPETKAQYGAEVA